MKKFISNILFQAVYQTIKLLMPVLTVPLVSHALGANKVGLYNYSNSIVQYFILLAGFGIPLYAQREIARVQKNKRDLSIKFWELEILSIIIGVPIVMLFLLFAHFSSMKEILLIQTLSIIAVSMDISWFFMGIEEFKKTSIRSIIISLSTFVLIFFFVKQPSDIYKYVLIQSGGIFLSQVIMWPMLLNKIEKVKIKVKDIRKHFPKTLLYFFPQISILLYTNINKTFLGFFQDNVQVAYYSNTILMISIITTLILTVDLVLYPRMSNLKVNNMESRIVEIISKLFDFQCYITVPAMFGLVLITQKMIPWFFGDEFAYIEVIMPIMAIQIFFNPIGNTLSRSYLLPNGRVKEYNFSIILGAIVGVFLNIFLVPSLGAFGSAIVVTLSQFVVTAIRMRSFIKETYYQIPWKRVFVYFSSSIIMFSVVYFVTLNFSSSFLTTLIQVSLGTIIYLFLTTILKHNPFLDFIKLNLKR